MKTYRSTSGPFTERPYYKVEEIELICTDELQKVNLMPSDPCPIRVERFIEKKFKINVSYEDLPEEVLGCIEFGACGVRRIIISRSLTENSSQVAERRINTTLAHEAGHGLLHTHLFALGQKPTDLFGGDEESSEPKILCRNGAVLGIQGYQKKSTYANNWWEYQANLVIGSLLLPQLLIMNALEPFLIKKGMMGIKKLDPVRRGTAERMLAQVFDVNPIVARIRLEGLFPVAEDSQLTL